MTTSSVVVQVEHGTDTATGTITIEAAVDADVLFLENAPTCRVFHTHVIVLGDVASLHAESPYWAKFLWQHAAIGHCDQLAQVDP